MMDWHLVRTALSDLGPGASQGCFRPRADQTGETSLVRAWETSCVDSGYGYFINPTTDDDSLTIFARYSVFDELTNNFIRADSLEKVNDTVLDIAASVLDEDESTLEFRIVGTNHSTLAAAQADANVVAAGWSLFANSADSGGTGVDGRQWSNTALTVDLPQFPCHPDSECWSFAGGDTYNELLAPAGEPLPGWLIGSNSPLQSVTLEAEHQGHR